VLLESFAACRKGVFDSEIGHHSLQPARFAARADSRRWRKHPLITASRMAPDAFGHSDLPENAPPAYGFFLEQRLFGCA